MKKVFKKYIPLLIFALSVGVMAAVSNGLMSLKMMNVVDYAIAGQQSGVLREGLYMLLFAGILLSLSTFLSIAKGNYRRRVNAELKKAYLQGVFGKNINEFNKESHARYVSGITNDLNTLDVNFVDGIFELSLAFITFAVTIAIVARVNLLMIAIIIGMSVIIAIISTLVAKPLKKMMKERSNLFEKYTGYLSEVLNAFRIIKTNNLTDKVRYNFHERGERLQNKSFDIDKLSTYIFMIQNFQINFMVIAIMAISVYFTIIGTMTFGGVILITSNLYYLISPFQRAGELYPKIVSSNVLFNSLDDSLKNAYDYPETIEFREFKRNITFKNVSFGYGEKIVFESINLDFDKGKKYLIVGPSGGGKSTFLKMLRKYHYPQFGEVLIDGVNLKDITKESYFKHIGNVDQNIFIFDDTLRNNLTLYRDVSDRQISLAVHNSGLDAFVEGLQDGLDMMLKDNGRNISGGEKSRIAIARALLEHIDIMFFDEAFANLDYRTAREIEKTVLEAKHLTVINVSHMIIRENLHLYDKVFYVGDKNIIERK